MMLVFPIFAGERLRMPVTARVPKELNTGDSMGARKGRYWRNAYSRMGRYLRNVQGLTR
jgi:hypothetical protein